MGGSPPPKHPQNSGVRGREHPPPPHKSLRAPRGAAPLPTAPFANINPSTLPWTRGGRRSRGLGDTPAVPTPNLPPPGFSGRSRARSRFPGSGRLEQLLPGHQQPGLEPGIRECGKGLAGSQGQRGWNVLSREDNRKGMEGGRDKGGRSRSQQLLTPRDTSVEPQDSTRAPPSLPRARQGSATSTPTAIPHRRRPRITPRARCGWLPAQSQRAR